MAKKQFKSDKLYSCFQRNCLESAYLSKALLFDYYLLLMEEKAFSPHQLGLNKRDVYLCFYLVCLESTGTSNKPNGLFEIFSQWQVMQKGINALPVLSIYEYGKNTYSFAFDGNCYVKGNTLSGLKKDMFLRRRNSDYQAYVALLEKNDLGELLRQTCLKDYVLMLEESVKTISFYFERIVGEGLNWYERLYQFMPCLAISLGNGHLLLQRDALIEKRDKMHAVMF